MMARGLSNRLIVSVLVASDLCGGLLCPIAGVSTWHV